MCFNNTSPNFCIPYRVWLHKESCQNKVDAPSTTQVVQPVSLHGSQPFSLSGVYAKKFLSDIQHGPQAMNVSEGACLNDSERDPVKKEGLYTQGREGTVFSVRFLRRLEIIIKQEEGINHKRELQPHHLLLYFFSPLTPTPPLPSLLSMTLAPRSRH